MATPLFSLSELAQNAGGGEAAYNETLRILEVLIAANVINETTTAAPGGPSEGDMWIIGAGTPSGAWAGQTSGHLALYINGGWVFRAPAQGYVVWNEATSVLRVYDSGAWTNA